MQWKVQILEQETFWRRDFGQPQCGVAGEQGQSCPTYAQYPCSQQLRKLASPSNSAFASTHFLRCYSVTIAIHCFLNLLSSTYVNTEAGASHLKFLFN